MRIYGFVTNELQIVANWVLTSNTDLGNYKS